MQEANVMLQGSGAPFDYDHRVAAAAERGFISTRRRDGERRVIEDLLVLGFRRPQLAHTRDGNVEIRAVYGERRVVRTFRLKVDGALPVEMIVAAAAESAERMEAKRIRAARKNRELPRRSAPPKPVCRVMEPAGARLVVPKRPSPVASVSAMNAGNDTSATFVKAAA